MLFAFDLDGTLIQTAAANWQAYVNIGVMPPPDFHQRRWEGWIDKETHDRKNQELAEIYRDYFKPLPLLQFAELQPYYILSSISEDAWRLWAKVHKFPNAQRIITNLTLEQKAAFLNERQPSLYFDDSAASCKYIQENTKWSSIQVTQS